MSAGTAAVLGLSRLRQPTPPTTAYLMLAGARGCRGSCVYCPQAGNVFGHSVDQLSRISWPRFPFSTILHALQGAPFVRICVQCLDVPDLIGVLVPVVEALRSSLTIPISVAIPPLNQEALLQLAEAGVTNVGLGLDACTPEVYAQAKGSAVGGLYTWDQHIAAVEAAGGVLGTARVSVHLIIGLGETEEDAIRLMAHFFRAGYNVGLFALMPVVGTPSETLQQPPLRQFRVLQLVRHLLVTKRVDLRDLQFEGGRLRSLGSQIGGKALQDYCHTFQVFETTGCVGCNRPYYTSKPGGVTYNYPAAVPPVDLETIAQELHYLVEDIG